jgi:hypothetical protein
MERIYQDKTYHFGKVNGSLNVVEGSIGSKCFGCDTSVPAIFNLGSCMACSIFLSFRKRP